MRERSVKRTLIYEPHALGRTGLRVVFGVATLTFVVFFAPIVLDRSNLPAQQSDTPQWALVGFVGAFLFAIGWNAYWFLVGSASKVRLDDGELRWESGARSGTMHVDEIVKIRNRFGFVPTIFSETNSVGLFPAKGIHDFVDAVTFTRPELRPKNLGFLARQAESKRRKALTVELRRKQ